MLRRFYSRGSSRNSGREEPHPFHSLESDSSGVSSSNSSDSDSSTFALPDVLMGTADPADAEVASSPVGAFPTAPEGSFPVHHVPRAPSPPPPPETAHLAYVWFRNRDRQQSRRQDRPVDVDEVEVDKYRDDDTLPTMMDIDAHDAQTRFSGISAATSDRTPIVSNRQPRTAATAATAAALRDIHENSHRRQGRSWTYLNIRTHQGKIVWASILILVLVVTVIVVAATVPQKSKGGSPASVEPPGVGVGGGGASRTSAPTMAPIKDGQDGGGSGGTMVPTSLIINTPTASPTSVLPTTKSPTSQPTFRPTAGPTLRPTSVPTDRPTFAPTRSPTSQPSSQPTPAPSSAPSFAPSSSPSQFPTLSLESISLDFVDAVEGSESRSSFGYDVSISKNGKVMAVGAPNRSVNGRSRAGSVQVYDLEDGAWTERGPALVGRNPQDDFGSAVAMNEDGSILAASEPTHDGAGDRSGNVRIFRYNSRLRSYELMGQELPGMASAAYFGVSLALSRDGYRVAVGAPYFSGENGLRLQGQVRVYEYEAGLWVLKGQPLSGTGYLDWLGSAVDLSDDGLILVASAPRSMAQKGYVRAWRWNDSVNDWLPLGNNDMVNSVSPVLADDRFGDSVSLTTVDSDTYRVAIGIPWKDVNGQRNGGMAKVYELDPVTDEWTLLGEPLTADRPRMSDEFGSAVYLEGGMLVVGIPGLNGRRGSAWVYRYQDDAWEPHPVPLNGNNIGDDFGVSLSLTRPAANEWTLVVGSIQASLGGAGFASTFSES